jgi:thiamine-phosphate pyrophosphorylase
MDQRLVTWARSVKPSATLSPELQRTPPLWLFTDAARMPDPLSIIRTLPKGLCGVVFRHDAASDRAALGAAIAKLCRARRLALVVAGDARLAARLQAGLHLRGGRHPGFLPLPHLRTASVHNAADLTRARRAGAQILFCSPIFPTNSHPGAPVLGPIGFRRLARHNARAKFCALGGMDGETVRRLGKFCVGIGAIDAFLCGA